MKNNKNDKEKITNINPIKISIFSTIATIFINLLAVFRTKILGEYGFGSAPFLGTIFIIFALLTPLFYKEQRKNVWTKKGLIILIVALVINMGIAIFGKITRYKLYGIL